MKEEENLQAQRAQRVPSFLDVEAATLIWNFQTGSMENGEIVAKELTVQFKPFAEQDWGSASMLLASPTPHFT